MEGGRRQHWYPGYVPVSRTPVPGNAATDRDVQYLMKIKRRVMFDENRSPEDKKEADSLMVKLIAILLSKRTPVPTTETAVPPSVKPTNGKTKPVVK